MLASNCSHIIDSRLLKMRLIIEPLRRSPHIGSEMSCTTSDNPPLSSLVLSHHHTGSLSQITGCGQTYGRPSMTSGALRSTLIDSRGLNRIELLSRIQSSTPAAPLAHMLS